jgi:hypothetical protein
MRPAGQSRLSVISRIDYNAFGILRSWYNRAFAHDWRPEYRVVDRAKRVPADRACPWCESTNVTFVQRGYAGLTDERDQYLVCAACKKTTYEIIAKSSREMRLGRYKPGDIYQDRTQNTRYAISRVLRSGANEFLIYLRPMVERASAIL